MEFHFGRDHIAVDDIGFQLGSCNILFIRDRNCNLLKKIIISYEGIGWTLINYSEKHSNQKS